MGDEFVLPFLSMGMGLLGDGDPMGEFDDDEKSIGFCRIGGNGGFRKVSVDGGDISFMRGGSVGGAQLSAVLLYRL
jgi:hypothetical protein